MQRLEPGQPGPRLSVSTPEVEVLATARGQEQLVLEFDVFRDGRGFSLAALLRARGFPGRLGAAGKVLPDQVRHLRRSGFDAVELAAGADPAPWQKLDQVYTAAYQPGGHDRQVWQARLARRRDEGLEALAARLNDEHADSPAEAILAAALAPELGRRAAAISSFGAEAAVLLHLVSRIRPDLPVIFLETGQHFFQTLAYRRTLSQNLGLSDVRSVQPDPAAVARLDPRGDLWRDDANACCKLRKVEPLHEALQGFDTRITGRKRYQNHERAGLRPFEAVDGSLIVNPLVAWTPQQIEAWITEHGLPRHPLVEHGYPSIGCWPCTRAVEPDDDPRGGRWAGQAKTECGIHRPAQREPA